MWKKILVGLIVGFISERIKLLLNEFMQYIKNPIKIIK